MSFNYFANKVRNSQLPRQVRLSAFGSCIKHLDRLNDEGYQVMRERFHRRFRLSAHDSGDKEFLAALQAIEQERNEVLQRLRAFEQMRREEKQQGKRVLSNEDQKLLNEITNQGNSLP